MNKHALMLTVATVALMAAPALAATTITTKKTTAQTTSSTGNLTIGSGGSVVIKAAGPAVEIDSNNWVKLSTSGSLVSNLNTDGAVGVQLDATSGGTGPGDGTPGSATALDSYGTIDLTGSGATKTGILVNAADTSGDFFNGDITLESGSTTKVAGDGSLALKVASGATLNGNITILGSLLATPTSTTATTSSSIVAVGLYGDINGTVKIGNGGSVQAVGAGADGMTIGGDVTGSLIVGGTLSAVGTQTPSTTATNPEAGSALLISGSIDGGIINAGPLPSNASITAGRIAVQGTGPAIDISPGSSSTGQDIGVYGSDSNASNFSFLNRGAIVAQSTSPNQNETAIQITGASGAHVTFDGGILNTGTVTASATSDGKTQQPYSAMALYIGNFVDVASSGTTSATYTAALVNSNETSSGQIAATVSGSTGGTATAVYIGAHSTLGSLINLGTISASANTSVTSITNLLAAYGIHDLSGSLASIANYGTISATATTLDSSAQIAVAAYLGQSTQDITFDNYGTVVGDITFGGGADSLNVNGQSGNIASVTGNIAFGGTLSGGGNDALTIGTTGPARVAGAVTESNGGLVDVTIGGGGTLTLKNTSTTLSAGSLAVDNGGTLNISLSNNFNQVSDPSNPALVTASSVSFAQTAKLNISFGSFISTPGGSAAKFTLFDSTGTVSFTDSSAIKTSVASTIPYLFNHTLCSYNVSGFTACGGSSSNQELVLQLTPKSAKAVGLTGNAAKIFPYANAALATDDGLGGAIVTYVTDKSSARTAYSSFLPDLSGSTRAVAISLTDQATGPVAARQRVLRMYASRGGETTLWGQEFVQRLTSGGNTSAYRGSGFGFVLGADSGNPRSGRYGGALTFFSGDQTNKGPNFTKISNQWYMLTGYTNWRGKGLFFDSQLTAGYGTLNGKRLMQLGDSSGSAILTRTATSKRASLLLAGGISTGVVLTYGGSVVTPQISFDALTLREEGYTESGGGSGVTGADGFDLKVQPYYASSARIFIGSSFRQDIDFGDFFIQPQARIGYRYDVLSDPVKLKAAFASMAGTSGNQFTLTGPDPERGDVVAGVGLAVTTGDWSLGVNYDYIHGNSGAISQGGTISLVGRI